MSILDKFNSIEIKNNNRLSPEDYKYCQEQEQLYITAHTAYTKALNEIMPIWEAQLKKGSYISEYGNCGIRKIQDEIVKITDKFISTLIWYFSNKYNIELKCNYEKYDGFNQYHDKLEKLSLITLDDVLDIIFAQLDGCTFKELSIKQMLNNISIKKQEYYEYRKYWNYEIKNKTIKFKVYINDILPALRYYDNNEIDLINCYTHNKIDDYKSYENGNTDIKFYSADEYESKGKEFSFDDAINVMIKSYLNTLDKKSDKYKNFLKEIKNTCNSLYDHYEAGRISADVYYAEIIMKMHQLISE
jgi:hypothetical protein